MPAPANLVLRDALPTDLEAIADIVIRGPDAAADWTYPSYRTQAAVTKPQTTRGFARLLKSTHTLLRVAEREGQVVGYCGWVKRERVGEEVVTVQVQENCDEKAIEAESVRLSGTSPLPKFADVVTSNPPRAAAIALLRGHQNPEPCLSMPSYQLLVLGVSEAQQGQGIGGALILEGVARAAASRVPVFVTGEGRGMKVYLHLGFQVLEGTWYGFDGEGKAIEKKEDDQVGEDGLEAAQMVWVPKGESVVVKEVVYTSAGTEEKK